MRGTPYVPEFIVVHLGRPDQAAENVWVTFPDYIKNVASSEIYPTWPENALRANIYAQISFALNRIYLEWYRSRGYDFDITNSTQYDQAFEFGRDVFENISQIVDEIFNDYLRRMGFAEPLFAQFCNGTTVTCAGLSQWGTVPLAQQGLTPYDILRRYYGDDIEIVRNAPVLTTRESYPGIPLRFGDIGVEVQEMQVALNRISRNYPAIGKISPTDGRFGESTEQAVKKFQQIFNLTQDGVIGKATWYKINYLYVGITRLGELNSEGVAISDLNQQFKTTLREGDSGPDVEVIQYYLRVIANFNTAVSPTVNDGIFGPSTTQSVRSFQAAYGLAVDGIVGRQTWNAMYEAYRGILNTLPPSFVDATGAALYPGEVLRLGSRGEPVRQMQEYLAFIANTYTAIPQIVPDGVFGESTREAVIAFQNQFGQIANGIVGPVTWDEITRVYTTLRNGGERLTGQNPGTPISQAPST